MQQAVVGYLFGRFDLFHIGHLDDLRGASEASDHLIVGVLSDAALDAAGAARPFVPQEERAEIVGAVDFVDQVVIVDSLDQRSVVAAHGVDVVFLGHDTPDTETPYSIRIVRLPAGRGTTSNAIRTALDEASSRSSVA